MKRITPHIVAFSGLFFMSVHAWAGNLTGDCDGWADSGTWAIPHPADVTATATLEVFDYATGTWSIVETSVDTQHVEPYGPFDVGGTWSGMLNGDYRVNLDFEAYVIYSQTNGDIWNFYDSFGSFHCAPPPPSNDRRTPGYWKTHPQAWGVSQLTLGGGTYSAACLDDMLDWPTQGDSRIKLIHHLIAAELNLLSSPVAGIGDTDPNAITNYPASGSVITETILTAHQFLISTGTTIDCAGGSLTGASPKGAVRTTNNTIKNALDDYNNNVDYGSTSGALTEESGGCSSMNGSANAQTLLLPLMLLAVLRRRGNRA